MKYEIYYHHYSDTFVLMQVAPDGSSFELERSEDVRKLLAKAVAGLPNVFINGLGVKVFELSDEQ